MISNHLIRRNNPAIMGKKNVGIIVVVAVVLAAILYASYLWM